MLNINWKSEALEFAKLHDTRNHMVIQLVEKAMMRGAEIAVAGVSEKLKVVNRELEKKRRESRPHEHQFKPLETI